MSEVIDLLAALREGTRRGAGREVDLDHPAPSTRGTGEGSGSVGRTSSDDEPTTSSYDRALAIRARLSAGTHTPADVEWARDRCRTPNLLTRGGLERLACQGCQWAKPVRYCGVEIASSPCELDSVCWRVERDAVKQENTPLPLWRLRKRNGKPNYKTASEQQQFLREAGWLAWSSGSKNGPAAGNAKTSGNRTQKVEWPLSWESWVEAQDDPLRVPPVDADRGLLAPWQLALLAADEPTPIEKLAAGFDDEDAPQASPWRRWTGTDDAEPCEVCGASGGWSVGGNFYCRTHAGEAQSALSRGQALPGALEAIDNEEVAA